VGETVEPENLEQHPQLRSNYACPKFLEPKKPQTRSIFFGHTWGTSILTQPSNHPAPTPTKIQKKKPCLFTLFICRRAGLRRRLEKTHQQQPTDLGI
jgi:hypothetical protein